MGYLRVLYQALSGVEWVPSVVKTLLRTANDPAFQALADFLARIPAVKPWMGSGKGEHAWWVKFGIDIDHPLAPDHQITRSPGHPIPAEWLEGRLPNPVEDLKQ